MYKQYVWSQSEDIKWMQEWDEITEKLRKRFVRSESTAKENGGKSERNGRG